MNGSGTPVGQRLSEALPNMGPGFFRQRYDEAVAGFTNTNNSLDERLVNFGLGAAMSPTMLLEEGGRGLVNAPRQLASGGENAAAVFTAPTTEDGIVAGLTAVRDLSFGIVGLAPLIPANRMMGPVVSTAEEVAARGFPGAEATAAAQGTYRGGAGGNWRVLNEGADSAVAQQATSTSRGQACLQMLLSDRGIAVQQAAFGSEMTSAQGLAGRLNTVESGWIGSGVPSSSFPALNQTGSWSAMMWERGARSGHWVVVDGVDNAGLVMIRDPFNATRYQMTHADFMEAWNDYSVYRPK